MTARYVVLRHTGADEPHYDLMFDLAPPARLVTWRSPIWPIDRPTTLTRLPDHRREYLTFEGEITGNRGRVERVAEGSCDVEVSDERGYVRWDGGALELRRDADDRWAANPAHDSPA